VISTAIAGKLSSFSNGLNNIYTLHIFFGLTQQAVEKQLYIVLIAYCLLKIIQLKTGYKGLLLRIKDFLTPVFMNHFPVLSVDFTANLNEFPKGGRK